MLLSPRQVEIMRQTYRGFQEVDDAIKKCRADQNLYRHAKSVGQAYLPPQPKKKDKTMPMPNSNIAVRALQAVEDETKGKAISSSAITYGNGKGLPPLPPDPEGMNDDRALWADVGLKSFQVVTGSDDEDALVDFLGDIMHWCDRRGQSFEEALVSARSHYEAETIEAIDDAETI